MAVAQWCVCVCGVGGGGGVRGLVRACVYASNYMFNAINAIPKYKRRVVK